MGYGPANPVERGKWNKGLASLRACSATPELITQRCAAYRARFGLGIPLSPMSLAGNWTTLGMGLPLEVPQHASVTTSPSVPVSQRSTSPSPSGGNCGSGSDGKPQWGPLRPSWGGRSGAQRSGGYHAAIVAEARAAGISVNELMDQRGQQYERDMDAYRRKWWPQDFADSDDK